jgi:hypothetical protein
MVLGLQHFAVIAPNLAIVVLVGRAAGADAGHIGMMISGSAKFAQPLEKVKISLC